METDGNRLIWIVVFLPGKTKRMSTQHDLLKMIAETILVTYRTGIKSVYKL